MGRGFFTRTSEAPVRRFDHPSLGRSTPIRGKSEIQGAVLIDLWADRFRAYSQNLITLRRTIHPPSFVAGTSSVRSKP
jgi:hypothetical protein